MHTMHCSAIEIYDKQPQNNKIQTKYGTPQQYNNHCHNFFEARIWINFQGETGGIVLLSFLLIVT